MSLSLPPGPRMPSALQALGWASRPLPFMERCHDRYGEIFTLRVRRGRPWVVLTDPEDVKLLFTTDPAAVTAGAVEASPVLEPLLGTRSVMLLDEPEHMAHRKLMLPSFRAGRMGAYGELIEQVARREIDTWPIGEPLALWPRMQAITTEVILRAVFGPLEARQLRRMSRLLRRMTTQLNNPRRLALLSALGPGRLSHSAWLSAVMKPVERAVIDEVRLRRASPRGEETEDILSMLERAHDRGGSPMDEKQVRDEVLTLLSDGPTATSLAWAFECLMHHPDKLARLQRESLAGADDSYAEAVAKETLRLCPVVPLVMRKLTRPMDIRGYTLPAGVTVAAGVYLIHRREDIYPRSRSFLPERFLEEGAPTYAWIPFGGGARRCLAANFAQLTIKRVMQTVLTEVELQPASASSSEHAARSSVAFVPDEQAMAIVTRRIRPRASERLEDAIGDEAERAEGGKAGALAETGQAR
jgi:cytochrome P450